MMVAETNSEKEKMKVLFVCWGNACRSPMAEYLFRERCEDEGLDIGSFSRGTDVSKDAKMNPTTLEVIAAYNPNLEMEAHHPQPITAEDALEADIILTLDTRVYCRMIKLTNSLRKLPLEARIKAKLFTFKGYLADKSGWNGTGYLYNVEDPYDKIRSPLFILYQRVLSKRLPKNSPIHDFFTSHDTIPNWGPFRERRLRVYEHTRQEIKGLVDSLMEKVRSENPAYQGVAR